MATLFVFAALCGNAAAQDNVSQADSNVDTAEETQDDSTITEPTPTEPPTGFDRDATYQTCLESNDIATCCGGYADCEEQMNRIGQMWTNAHGQTFDEVAEAECRSRRGTWQDGQCNCANPNRWFGTTEAPQQCCVPNVARYERRMHACEDSGGNWTCSGECHCNNPGQLLLDGECVGTATTREEVERMRNRIPELVADMARLEGELSAAQENGEDQTERIAELGRQLEAVNGELNDLRELLALREQQLRDELGRVPPAPPGTTHGLDEIPGTAEAIAEAAGRSQPGPMEPVPPPEEEEGNWCEENGWACAGIIIGTAAALTGATVGIVEATRDIEVTQ